MAEKFNRDDFLGETGDGLGKDFKSYSELHEEIGKLEYLMSQDPLTEISSLRELEKTYEQIIKKDEVACMIYVDVDKFKSVNDTYGHLAGNQVLKIVGSILKTHINPDDIVAREGGEEFVMILRDFDNLAVAEKRADDLRQEVQDKKFLLKDGRILSNTISIGVSVRQKGESIESWKERTDKSLYIAKQTGRNKVVVAQSV